MNPSWRVGLLISIFSASVFVTGIASQICLGDEVYHWRFAKDIFHAGHRVPFDPVFGSSQPPGYFYNSEPMWHSVLAFIWRVTGGVSQFTAQIYHTTYYILLLLATYFLSKTLYNDQKHGFYAMLIVATCPVVLVFSVLFYLDVPATALSTLCLLVLLRRKIFLASLVFGLMFLMKRNTYFFLPAYIALYYHLHLSMRGLHKLRQIALFCIPAIICIVSDTIWREYMLRIKLPQIGRSVMNMPALSHTIATSSDGPMTLLKHRLMMKDWNLLAAEYLNSHLLNGVDVLKYFGLVLVLLLSAYLILKQFERKDLVIWSAVGSFMFLFAYMFRPSSDIRYLLPIFPLLAVVASKTIVRCVDKRRFTCVFFAALCFCQFAATLIFTYSQRQINPMLKAAFEFIKKNTSPHAIIMYPEYLMIEATGRRFVWAGTMPVVLRNTFWNPDEVESRNLLHKFAITHIAIKKSRIYDDSTVKHYGGYPKSFVKRLPGNPYLKLIFDNEQMSLWQVE